jgi:hypothetical protein
MTIIAFVVGVAAGLAMYHYFGDKIKALISKIFGA